MYNKLIYNILRGGVIRFANYCYINKIHKPSADAMRISGRLFLFM